MKCSTLQETSQLGVSVRDVTIFAIDKSWNDVAQCRKWQVDLGGLFQPLTWMYTNKLS